MAQIQMYPASVNSISTTLNGGITNVATSITVTDGSKLPTAPCLLTIGSEEDAETILMTIKNTNTLTVTRGVEGTVKAWDSGEIIARTFTAYDHDAFKDNIEDLDSRVSNFDTTDLTDYAENAASHSGLNFAYKAGRVRNDNVITSVVASTLALTDDATNYIEVDPADGTVSKNTTAFTTAKIPLFTVATAAGVITTVTDQRAFLAAPAAANGIPQGGVAGQVLEKVDSTDYNAQWVDPPSAGGVPVGAILWVPSSAPPAGMLPCNGDILSQSAYADLYAVIGSSFNGIPLVPKLYANDSGGWRVSASTQDEPAWQAFDQGVANSRWRASTSTGWIKIECPTGFSFTVASYKITGNHESNYVNRSPKSWVLKDAAGNIIDTQSDQINWTASQERTYTLSSTVTTTALLFESITCGQDSLVIQELKIIGPAPSAVEFALPSLNALVANVNPYIKYLLQPGNVVNNNNEIIVLHNDCSSLDGFTIVKNGSDFDLIADGSIYLEETIIPPGVKKFNIELHLNDLQEIDIDPNNFQFEVDVDIPTVVNDLYSQCFDIMLFYDIEGEEDCLFDYYYEDGLIYGGVSSETVHSWRDDSYNITLPFSGKLIFKKIGSTVQFYINDMLFYEVFNSLIDIINLNALEIDFYADKNDISDERAVPQFKINDIVFKTINS